MNVVLKKEKKSLESKKKKANRKSLKYVAVYKKR